MSNVKIDSRNFNRRLCLTVLPLFLSFFCNSKGVVAGFITKDLASAADIKPFSAIVGKAVKNTKMQIIGGLNAGRNKTGKVVECDDHI